MRHTNKQPKAVIIAATIITLVIMAAICALIIAGIVALLRWVF